MKNKNIALILAGGKGIRFGSDIPKQFVEIENKPLIVRTLEKISKNENINEIYIVCLQAYVNDLKEIIIKYRVPKVRGIIVGGATRHESIKNGINCLVSNGYDGNDRIIIHNANMPLVTDSNISDCLLKCAEQTVVATAAECNDFFYQIDQDTNKLMIGPNRKNLMDAKQPEAMYLKIASYIYNDERFNQPLYESYPAGMLGIILGLNIEIVKCGLTNMKITTQDDYKLMEIYIKNEESGQNEI